MINIFVIGPLKSGFIIEGVSQYKKWLSKFEKVNFIQIPLQGDLNKLSPEEYKKNDYLRIKKYIDTFSYNIILDERGKELSSVGLSEKIDEIRIGPKKNINFFIGGPLGHYKELYNNCDFMLSFSKMTFTHEMIVLFLYEQLYRSFKILNNEKYHY